MTNIPNPRPVTDYENDQVRGAATLPRSIFYAEQARLDQLRQRQEAYTASLPKDPVTALADVYSTLPELGEYAEPHYAARAALDIIHQLATHGALDDSLEIKQSVYWLTTQGLNAMRKIESANKRAKDIARQFHPHIEPFRA